MREIYSLDSIRSAERRALASQAAPDHLMRQAAAHIADAADWLLRETGIGEHTRATTTTESHMADCGAAVLLLVGPGGNGGDALYAGALLRQRGYEVSAWLSGSSCHPQASKAFHAAGGEMCEDLARQTPALTIDGIAGLGSARAIPSELAEFLHNSSGRVLAIDVPTGVNYDTAEVPELIETNLGAVRAHVVADETIAFQPGGVAHALSPWCGEVLIREVRDQNGNSISDHLRQNTEPVGRYLPALMHVPAAAREPSPTDNKYSGGVVGICAGSAQYPGAALLAAGSAVRATSAMVRFLGPADVAGRVIAAYPEVVAHQALEDAGRCDAWVVGPGWGTTAERAEELAQLLERPEPVVLDADALTLLAEYDSLRMAVRKRGSAGHSTLLTPHGGEFARLADVLGLDVEATDVIRSVPALALELDAVVLHKGWATVIANGAKGSDGMVQVWQARSSWAATPGTGDVLAGIAGAYAAHAWKRSVDLGRPAESGVVLASLLDAVRIHDAAVWQASHASNGAARPTSASEIMAHIRTATAALGTAVASRASNSAVMASRSNTRSSNTRNSDERRPVAIVTGASRGIGHAIAKELQSSHELILVSSRPNPQLSQDFPEAHCLAADLNDVAAAVDSLVKDIEVIVGEQGRGLDVLVHNAGVTGHDPLVDTTLEQWHTTFNVNVFAVAELTRALVPQLERAHATVVFINSGAGLRAAGKGYGSYAASKFALTGYADALREEHRGAFRVTSVHPGKTDSDMQRHIQGLRGVGEDAYDPAKFVKPESIAAAVRVAIDATLDACIETITVRPAGEAG